VDLELCKNSFATKSNSESIYNFALVPGEVEF
jgi:hypothetical protein